MLANANLAENLALAENFQSNNFYLFSKNMQPNGNPRKSGKILGDQKFR